MKFDGMNSLDVLLVNPSGKPLKELKNDKYKTARVVGVRRYDGGRSSLKDDRLELVVEVEV